MAKKPTPVNAPAAPAAPAQAEAANPAIVFNFGGLPPATKRPSLPAAESERVRVIKAMALPENAPKSADAIPNYFLAAEPVPETTVATEIENVRAENIRRLANGVAGAIRRVTKDLNGVTIAYRKVDGELDANGTALYGVRLFRVDDFKAA